MISLNTRSDSSSDSIHRYPPMNSDIQAATNRRTGRNLKPKHSETGSIQNHNNLKSVAV